MEVLASLGTSWDFHWTYFHALSMRLSLDFHEKTSLRWRRLWDFHGTSMGFRSDVCGTSMDLLFIRGALKCLHGVFMGHRWCFHITVKPPRTLR